jgi:hypothetical protein
MSARRNSCSRGIDAGVPLGSFLADIHIREIFVKRELAEGPQL